MCRFSCAVSEMARAGRHERTSGYCRKDDTRPLKVTRPRRAASLPVFAQGAWLDPVAHDRSLADAIGHELNRLTISTKLIVAENRAVIVRVADALLIAASSTRSPT